MSQYIHYGADRFDINKFMPIKNNDFPETKPVHGTGLWASATDAKFGWKDWCEAEGFHLERLNKHFTFTLKNDAKVLHINSVKVLEDNAPKMYSIFRSCFYTPDFVSLAKRYDAIELHLSDEIKEDRFSYGLYHALYSWDCDSILIMNPDIIEV